MTAIRVEVEVLMDEDIISSLRCYFNVWLVCVTLWPGGHSPGYCGGWDGWPGSTSPWAVVYVIVKIVSLLSPPH